MSESTRPKFLGALLECFVVFPLFGDDYGCLVDNGFIRQVSPQRCEWLKSKTSLAEYFHWIGADAGRITGGFWRPVSTAFGMDKGRLQKLAGQNGNQCKPDESKDFVLLKRLVLPRRCELHRIREEAAIFNAIIKLLKEIKSNTPETIHDVLQKITKILRKNVEKNVIN